MDSAMERNMNRRNNSGGFRHPLRNEFFKKLKIPIDILEKHVIIQKLSDTAIEYGGIAQLGERLNGIQEVSGSIPLISTRKS